MSFHIIFTNFIIWVFVDFGISQGGFWYLGWISVFHTSGFWGFQYLYTDQFCLLAQAMQGTMLIKKVNLINVTDTVA